MRKTIFFLIIIFHSVSIFCATKVFLHSKYVMRNEKLFLSDIASFGGTSVLEMEIPVELYKDGFVDRKEILNLLMNHQQGEYMVYGSAVRVLPVTIENSRDQYYIRKGDTVDILLKRKNIKIKVIGKSLVNAYVGQTIKVEIDNRKLYSGSASSYRSRNYLRGVLKKGKVVEVIL